MGAFDWEQSGCEVVGLAEDGEIAAEMARTYRPDIIITDINMPFLNGLEFCSTIRDALPDSEIIVVTGYDDFEYARHSVELKVSDYLVKPVSEIKFSESIWKSIRVIEGKQANRTYLLSLEEQLNLIMPVMKERFWEQILKGHHNEAEIRDKANYYGINTIGRSYKAFIVQIDQTNIQDDINQERNSQLMFLGICDLINSSNAPGVLHGGIRDDSRRMSFLLEFANSYQIDDVFLDFALLIKQEIQSKLAAIISIGIGPTCNKLSDASRSCQSAIYALNYGHVTGHGMILDSKYLEPDDFQVSVISLATEMEMYKHLRIGDMDKVAASLAEIQKNFQSAKLESLDLCRTIYLQMLISTFRLAGEMLPNTGSNPNKWADYPSRLIRKNSLSDMEKYVSECILSVCQSINDSRSTKYYKLIADAQKFTCEKYSEAISLQVVADYVHMAATYFSYIFKKETGENWSSFLTRIRIEKAMELLYDPLVKTYEVAFLVGFNEPNYFSNQFKKIVGCSPSEYRTSKGKVT